MGCTSISLFSPFQEKGVDQSALISESEKENDQETQPKSNNDKKSPTSKTEITSTPATQETNTNSSTVSAAASGTIANKACFGAGCYWGTEKYLYSNFNSKFRGVGEITEGQVGFMSPDKNAVANPSYKKVCSGETGHIEVYDCTFTGGETYYEAMVKFFFQFHDPTTSNKQGNDVGTQYQTVIFYYDEQQKAIAEKVKADMQDHLDNGRIKAKYDGKVVTTKILPATIFYPAHLEHQEYLSKNPDGYCNHRIRFVEWPTSN